MLRFRAVIDRRPARSARAITNTGVVTWNNPPQTARASVSIDVGGIVGVGVLNGTAWHDANFDDGRRSTRARCSTAGRSSCIATIGSCTRRVTDATGVYRISGIAPNYATADRYELRFRRAGRGRDHGEARSRALGVHERSAADHRHRRAAGQQPAEPQSADRSERRRLQLDRAHADCRRDADAAECGSGSRRCRRPASTIRRSRTRSRCADGYYRFDLNFSDPACPSGGNYLIDVTAPATGYIAGLFADHSAGVRRVDGARSRCRPARRAPTTRSPATAQHCEVQTSEFAPPPSVRARTRGHALPRAPDARRQPGAGLEPDLQQPHPARSGSAGRAVADRRRRRC